MDWKTSKSEIEETEDPYFRLLAYIDFMYEYDDLTLESLEVDQDIADTIQETARLLTDMERLLIKDSIIRQLHPMIAHALLELITT